MIHFWFKANDHNLFCSKNKKILLLGSVQFSEYCLSQPSDGFSDLFLFIPLAENLHQILGHVEGSVFSVVSFAVFQET